MRVMVAMSGGVDSSVAAALLVEDGHDVTGVTLKLWGGETDSGCCSVSDVDDARRVAQQLGIDHFVFNFGDDFDRHVVTPYIDDHLSGRTPNPCIECNRHLKFDRLLERARALDFELLATGHHVRVVETEAGPRLGRAVDQDKDQSYVLHMLEAEVIGRCIFPVGAMTKAKVREHADRLGLRTAHKPESQDVCFITKSHGRRAFLETRAELTPGVVVDTAGTTISSVGSVELVTIGQRRGLGLSGPGERTFAIDVDVKNARVTVGTESDLLRDGAPLRSHVWAGAAVVGKILAQVSAHGDPVPASLDASGQLTWDSPQRRVAPGQSVVFYDGDTVVGGAIANEQRSS
jgi:tRNA-specific 2-thiouridylase